MLPIKNDRIVYHPRKMHYYILRIIVCTLAWLGIATCSEMQERVGSQVVYAEPSKESMMATIKGDLMLGGLFSLHRNFKDMECQNQTSDRNIMRVEAILYAIEEVSERQKNQ